MKAQDLRNVTIQNISTEDKSDTYKLLHWAAERIEHLEWLETMAGLCDGSNKDSHALVVYVLEMTP